MYLLSSLSEVFAEGDDTVIEAHLRKCLQESWALIQGTCVDYLSEPDSEITELMVSIAERIDPANPLRALMPGVEQVSVHEDCPDLDTLPIREVLRNHVLSDSGHYLYPVHLIRAIDAKDMSGKTPFNPLFL